MNSPANERTAEHARAHYDKVATRYDREMAEFGYCAPSRVAKWLASSGIGRGAQVLDLCSGTGLVGVALHEAGVAVSGTIVGVDISDESLDECLGSGAYSRIKLHDVNQKLPFDTGMFDAIVCVGGTEFIEDFRVLFSEMTRVARDGALLCWTHRAPLWDADDRGCASVVQELQESMHWKQVRMVPPENHTPTRPDTVSSGGEHGEDTPWWLAPEYIFIFRRYRHKETEDEAKRKAQEEAERKRQESVENIRQEREMKSGRSLDVVDEDDEEGSPSTAEYLNW